MHRTDPKKTQYKHSCSATFIIFVSKIGGTSVYIPPLTPDQPPFKGCYLCYVDGSLLDEPRRFARRTGFAIGVLDSCGRQVAFGYGWPLAWVETAAAAGLPGAPPRRSKKGSMPSRWQNGWRPECYNHGVGPLPATGCKRSASDCAISASEFR